MAGESEVKGGVVATIPIEELSATDPRYAVLESRRPSDAIPVLDPDPEAREEFHHEAADVYPPRVAWETHPGGADGDYEFRLIGIRPTYADPPCRHQPDYPFRQSLGSKYRSLADNWYTRVIFDPIPEAFPGVHCSCDEHEYKATAEVRRRGGAATFDPGQEVDPHVVFHPGRGRDQPPP